MSVENIVKTCFRSNFKQIVSIITEAIVDNKVHADDLYPTVTQILELFFIHLEQVCDTVIGQENTEIESSSSSSENSSTESENSSELSSEEEDK